MLLLALNRIVFLSMITGESQPNDLTVLVSPVYNKWDSRQVVRKMVSVQHFPIALFFDSTIQQVNAICQEHSNWYCV